MAQAPSERSSYALVLQEFSSYGFCDKQVDSFLVLTLSKRSAGNMAHTPSALSFIYKPVSLDEQAGCIRRTTYLFLT